MRILPKKGIKAKNTPIIPAKGDIMDDKFLVGVVLGMLGGAVLVTNSVKARQAVKSGQEQVMDKMEGLTKQSKKKPAQTK